MGTNKKGMSTNSNAYTLIYAAVMVVIVAFLLSFISSSLKERQDQNVKFDKMKQILSAINVNDVVDAQGEYDKYVKTILDAEGADLNQGNDFDKVDGTIIYQCDVDGATKFVIPMTGNGLWGPIWGYIALDEDRQTVYGIYFNHESETPGLGAEIVSDAFKTPFHGKSIVKDGKLTSIAVVKKGQSAEGQDYVDGISGGTITSTAVSDMLKSTLANYESFVTAAPTAQDTTTVNEAEVIDTEAAGEAETEKED